jgi:hypothetical protein
MSAEFHKKRSINTVNHFKFWLILTVSAAVLGLGKSGALATVWNISETQPCLQLHRVRVAQRGDRNLSNSKGTLKEGSAICVDRGGWHTKS